MRDAVKNMTALCLPAQQQDRFSTAIFQTGMATPDDILVPVGACRDSRFSIYRNNVISSLTQALESTFPVTCQALGKEYFTQLAAQFVRLAPPSHPVLLRYGQGFPSFLDCQSELAAFPFISSLATLELLYVASFHAADATPLSQQDLAALQTALGDPEQLARIQISLHPALRLLDSDYAVGSLWALHQGSNDQQQLGDAIAKLEINQPQSLLIARNEQGVFLLPIERAASAFLGALMASGQLMMSIETAQARCQDEPFDPTPSLVLLLSHGLLTGYCCN